MKKLIVTLLAGVATLASADLTSFRWYNTATGNLKNSGNVDIVSGGATVLTYLSPDNTKNFDPSSLLQPSYGNDIFYAALGNGLPGRLTTSYMTEPNGGDDYRGWFAYAVVLDLPYATFSGGTIGGDVTKVSPGTYYTVTAAFGGLKDMTPLPTPTPDTFNAGTLVTSSTVIPEPATIGLMGIAGLGMFLARRKARR